MEKLVIKNELVMSLLALYKMPVCGVLSSCIEGENAVLIYLLNEEDLVTPSLISEKMHITRGRVSSIINSLKRHGFITLKSSKVDRRVIYVSLTTKGKEYTLEKIKIADEYFNVYVEKMGLENINELIKLINLSVLTMNEVRL